MTGGRVVVAAPDASTEDLDALGPLWCQMQQHQIAVTADGLLNEDLERGWKIRRSWYVDELAKGGTIIRAHRDGVLVGYCAVRVDLNPDETFRTMAMATVITLSVEVGSRGEGVGTALLEAAEDFARSCGADTLALEVMPGNHRARVLYERQGFVPVEVRMHRPIDPLS